MHHEIKDFFQKSCKKSKIFFLQNPLKRSKRFESIKNLNPHISILPQL